MGRRLKNPSPLVIVGTLAGLGLVSYVGYEYMSEAKAAKPKSKGKTGGTTPPSTKPSTKPATVDNWGTGMTASTQALSDGVPIKIFKDQKGLWNFGYSWKERTEGAGSGLLWDWLRSADTPEDTIVVLTQDERPDIAYQRAGDWTRNLKRMVETFLADTNMEPGFFRTQGTDFSPFYIKGRDRWGLIGLVPEKREGSPDNVQFIDGDSQWYYHNNTAAFLGDSGCCYTAIEAEEFLTN